MSRAEGDIVITVGGNVSPLTDAMGRAERTLGKLNTATQRADKQFRAMVGTSSELQSRINALTGFSDRLAKSAEKSASAFEGFRDAQRNVDRLRASFDPIYAATKQYEVAVEQLDDAMAKGVITQGQYAMMVDKLAQKHLAVSGTTGKLVGDLGKVGAGSSKLGNQVQNASYQVGDFFVQIASGTDATRALAQQLPQLLGAFGVFGAVAGAAVAIGGALIPMLIGTTEKAKTSQEAVDALSASLDAYTGYLEVASASTSELTEKYGAFAGRIRELSEYMSRVALRQAMDDLTASLEPVKGGLSEIIRLTAEVATQQEYVNSIPITDAFALEQAQSDLAQLKEALAEAAKEMGLNAEQGVRFAAVIDKIGQANGMREVAIAAGEASDFIKQMYEDGFDLPRPLQDAAGALEQIAAMAANAVKKEQEMYNWASRIQNILGDIWAGTPGSGWLAGEISDAAKLAQNLWNAAKAKAAALEKSTGQTKGDGSWYDGQTAESLLPPKRYGGLADPKESGGKGGGGGGGKKEDPKEKLADFQKTLMTEGELEALSFQERLKQLQEFNAAKLLSQTEYNATLEKLQQQHQDRMAEIDVYRYGDGLQKAGAFMGDMASAFQSGNEKMQKIGQKFAAAEALINAWRAFSQTLADPSLPFAAKFVAATKALAAGMGAVNAIKGGSSSSSGSKSSAAATGGQQAYQPVTANIHWQGDMTPASMTSLTEKLNREYKQGYRLNFVGA